MAGLPTTRFYLDDGTGTFPDDITPYVRLTDGFTITRGRADTESGATAGSLSLVVNNATGAFTPGATVLASPTTIKVDQRIKVVETINGVAYTRFTGYVKSWAVSWLDVVETTSIVRITATDAQARAERFVLRSVIEEEIYTDSPAFIYPLQEPAGAGVVAADTSGNQHATLQNGGSGTSVVLGDSSAGWVGAKFANGKYLTNGESITVDATTTATFIVKFRTSTSPGGANIGSLFGGPAQNVPTPLGINGAPGGSLGSGVGGGLDTSPTLVIDGIDHVGVLTVSAGFATLYLDGVSFGSAAINPSTFSVQPGDGFTGVLSYVGYYPTALSGARVTAISQALLNGFAGESGVARITRLAGYAKVPLGTLDPSLTNVPGALIEGSSAWQAIQEVADAEGGVAYVAGDGTMTFHNRQRVTSKLAPDLILSGYVKPDAEPTTDDEDLVNYLETSSSVTGVVQVVRNTVSEAAHGRYADSKTYLVLTDPEALDRGNWEVAVRAEPASSGRYASLTVNLFGMTAVQQAAVVAALESGCWFRAVNMPSQTTGGTTVDVVVEGISETQNGDDWEITCNVVPKTALYPVVWILGTSALGVDTRLGV